MFKLFVTISIHKLRRLPEKSGNNPFNEANEEEAV